MALFVTILAVMERVARIREWGIGIVVGPPAVSRCYVRLRCERMVGPNWVVELGSVVGDAGGRTREFRQFQ